MNQKIKQLWELIKKSNKILLINHIRMDPDAFWSLGAFYYVLSKLNKDVKAINDEDKPIEFSFLDENNIFEPNLDLKSFNPDLIISFDAASIWQLWETYIKNKDIFQNTNFIVIDHHVTNPWFGKINIIDVKASSTCELVFNIFESLDLVQYITPKIATLLNAWILTDTNVFYNTNVTSKTHLVTWKLLELWSDSRKSIFEFFKKKSLIKTKLLGKALTKLKIVENKLENNKNIVYTLLTKQDFNESWANDRDTSGIIEHLINIENVEIAFVVYPLNNWINKISFRSHTLDVSTIAQNLWWGWHKQAAWVSLDETIDAIEEKILKEIIK